MTDYFRPILHYGRQPKDAYRLAGGWCWFTQFERIQRGAQRQLISAAEAPEDVLAAMMSPRAPIAGLAMDRPRIMAIANVTPDSFSDGGKFESAEHAITSIRENLLQVADIIDIGGESTRPGAREVSANDEIARVEPIIAELASADLPISIDTRKEAVAKAALGAGASIVNDVSALTFDENLAKLVAKRDVPICLMHAQGLPETMQVNPTYDDVLLDVYDGLADAVERAVAAGISRNRIMVDPGIGFGKTLSDNLSILKDVAVFHGLGCVVLLGASRKRFLGTLTGREIPQDRVAGSLAVTVSAVLQGIQIHRVHDIRETREAFDVLSALILDEQA